MPLLVEAEVERPRGLFLLLAGTPVLLAGQFDYDVAELKILNFTVVKMKKENFTIVKEKFLLFFTLSVSEETYMSLGKGRG